MKIFLFIERILEDIQVIKDCRKRYRKNPKINTRFLAHIASIPEWTITLLNKPKK